MTQWAVCAVKRPAKGERVVVVVVVVVESVSVC